MTGVCCGDPVEVLDGMGALSVVPGVPCVAQPVNHSMPARHAMCKIFIETRFSIHAVPQKRRPRRSGR